MTARDARTCADIDHAGAEARGARTVSHHDAVRGP
jgi:hypothetical protein